MAYVRIDVDDEQAPADLFTRAETAEFQEHLYGDAVRDQQTVLEHWAYNAIANGVQDPARLDGWADMPRGVVSVRVTDVEEGF
jgi:hypothetical protein